LSYPAPYDAPCKARTWRRLGDAAGLTQFGVNLVRLPPGTWSSQRHWHAREDEFVHVFEGELVLVTNEGETKMVAGDCAGFKAGVPDGHCFQNRSAHDAVMLVVGTRDGEDHGESTSPDGREDFASPPRVGHTVDTSRCETTLLGCTWTMPKTALRRTPFPSTST
jgi:uncharacterized cupin superfamily protein